MATVTDIKHKIKKIVLGDSCMILFTQSNCTFLLDDQGNGRGACSIDLQVKRANITQINGGNASVLTGGVNNTVAGSYSVIAGGCENSVSVSGGFIGGGCGNIAVCNAFVGSGSGNCACGNWSVVNGGCNNVTITRAGIILGGICNSASNAFAVAGGAGANTSGGTWLSTNCFSVAPTILAPGCGSVVSGGLQNRAMGPFTVVGGGCLNCACCSASVISGGWNNSATNSYIFVGGGCGNGTGAFGATIAGGLNNSINGNYGTIAGGRSNIVWDNYSFVGAGCSNTVLLNAVLSSVVGGGSNTICCTAAYASILGGRCHTNSSFYSSVIAGIKSRANLYGQVSWGVNQFSTNFGNNQFISVNVARVTTDATSTDLTTDAATPGAANRIFISSGKMLSCIVHITGITSTGADAVQYLRQVLIANVGGTTALIGTVQTLGTDIVSGGAGTWTVAITANNTNDALTISVTGATSTTIRWSATVQGTEIEYGS